MTDSNLTRYPLCWPAGWPRSATKRSSSFGTKRNSTNGVMRQLSVIDGCERVTASLAAMGIPRSTILISTNVRQRQDGLPRSDQPEPSDRGVAVYWLTRQGKQQCMALDRYHRVADNLAAIAATLEAMRAIERHGGADVLDRAFTGFAALPAPEQPWQVLGLETSHVTEAQVQEAYRRLAMEHHPDRGGDPAEMARINAARDDMLRGLGL